MGFRSGLSGGVFHQLMYFASKNLFMYVITIVFRVVILLEFVTIRKIFDNKRDHTSFKDLQAFIMPLNITICVAHLAEIPSQMCILAGCFGCGLSAQGSLFFLKQSLPWWSNCTVHSSVNSTFSNLSFTSVCFLHHSFLLSLFSYISYELTVMCESTNPTLSFAYPLNSGQGNIQTFKSCCELRPNSSCSYFIILPQHIIYQLSHLI